MKALLPALLMLTAAAAQAETYRWVEKVNGADVVHYSDMPREGADQVQVTGKNVVANGAAKSARGGAPVGNSRQKPEAFSYQSCAITSPTPEQSMLELSAVTVVSSVVPGKRDIDKLRWTIDGVPVPGLSTSHIISPIERGEHSVSLTVLDLTGKTLCQSPVVRFYIQQPSVLKPKPKP